MPHLDRGAPPPPDGGGQRGDDRLKVRAADPAYVGAPLDVTELELALPGPGEVVVRLVASGVCHSDGTSRLSRDGEPVYHYSYLSTFAERTVVPERCCIPIADDVPFEVAALVGCGISTAVRTGPGSASSSTTNGSSVTVSASRRSYDVHQRDGVDAALVSLQPTPGADAVPELVSASCGRLLALATASVRDGFVGTTVAERALAQLGDAVADAVRKENPSLLLEKRA